MTLRVIPPLYKYINSQRLFKLLESPSIRFTQPDCLNDPYECHLTLDGKALIDDYREFRKSKTPDISEEDLTNSIEMAKDQLIIDALLHYRERRNSFGVISLTENPLNLLMWAHYGDEHRGAVIEFDISHPSLRPGSRGGDEYSDIRKIDYTQNKIYGLPIPETIVKVLSTKSIEWDYEREWRLVRTLNMTKQVSENVWIVEFDLSAVKTIYLGARFHPQQLKTLITLLKNNNGNHIKILKVDIAPHRFELRTTNVHDYGWKLLHREHHFGEAAHEALICLPMDTDPETTEA